GVGTVLIVSDDKPDAPNQSQASLDQQSRRGVTPSNPNHTKTQADATLTKTEEDAAADAAARKNSQGGAESNDEAKVEPVAEPDGVAFSATLSGWVVDPKGRALSGASVSAVLPDDGGAEQRPLSLCGSVKTNEFGAFSISVSGRRSVAVQRAFIALEASLEGFAPTKTYRYTLGDGESMQGVRIPLRPSAGEIHGRVIRESDGAPLAGVSVSADAWLGAPDVLGSRERSVRVDVPNFLKIGPVTTASDGSFVLRNLPEGRYDVKATLGAPKATSELLPNAMPRPAASASTQSQVLVKAGIASAEVELKLPVFQGLSFTLSPKVEGAVYLDLQIWERANLYRGDGFGVAIAPDEEGVYRADWLSVDHKFALIKAKGFEQRSLAIAPRHGEDLDLGEVQLEAGLALEGRVVRAEGAAGVANAEVWLRVPNGAGGGMARPGGFQANPRLIETRSDDAGRFVLEDLPRNGTFEIAAIAEGFAEGASQLRLTTGDAPAGFEVRLSEAALVFGKVAAPPLDSGGMADHMLEDDVVVFTTGARTRVKSTTAMDSKMLGFLANSASLRYPLDADGNYRAEALPAGEYFALGIRDRRITFVESVVVKAGQEQRVDFAFPPPGGVIEGRLTRNGVALAGRGMQLSFAPLNGRKRFGGAYTETDRDGYYRFEGVRNDIFTVRVSGETLDESEEFYAARRAEMRDGDVIVMDIDLKEFRANLRGRVSLGGAFAFSSARADHLDPAVSDRNFSARVGNEGQFEIIDLPSGEYQIVFSGGEGFRNQYRAMAKLSIEEGQAEAQLNKDFAIASVRGAVQVAGIEGGLPKITISAKRIYEPE
ncbi:MAG: carboxypeptidase regulatory-like domain-containing protein, partial [Planctomycetes bacterium]|nr:carboxypeptidase regulatory-like domain-containing protein [Planctomycetota bacterium]